MSRPLRPSTSTHCSVRCKNLVNAHQQKSGLDGWRESGWTDTQADELRVAQGLPMFAHVSPKKSNGQQPKYQSYPCLRIQMGHFIKLPPKTDNRTNFIIHKNWYVTICYMPPKN